MIQNLKEFVCKYVEKQNKSSFPHLYIVDKQTGPYRKIQDAIDAAQPGSLIKVTQGFYEQNLVITKPLTIQPKSRGQNPQIGVVLLVQTGIGIHIKLPYSQSSVSLTGLKISHTGNSPQLHMQLLDHQSLLNLFQDPQPTPQLQQQLLTRISFPKVENMILFLQSGKLYLNLCVLSLKYLVKGCRMMIPAVGIERDGELNMDDCEIKGNGNAGKPTVGVMCRLGVLMMKNCVITDHSQGGVLVWGMKDNGSKMVKNRIEGNGIGVQVIGDQFKFKLCQNQIIKNKIGVKVGLACEVEISRNFICQNENGIEVHSSFPIIYLNKIDKNKQNGIKASSYKSMICNAKIKKNVSISGNGQNGIVIQGENNKTKIVQNYLISFNKQCGIKITNDSFPLVLKNFIHKNHAEGILITQCANAVIQANTISYNIQCNIALGGSVSHNTLIVSNRIEWSPGPGIVMIDGMANISRNDISHNLQGLLLQSSNGRIRRNYISHNKNNGIYCKQECNPTLVQNFITRNESIGLFIREEGGFVNSVNYSNIVVSNEINVGLLFKNQAVVGMIKASNTVEGDVDQPKGIRCQLM